MKKSASLFIGGNPVTNINPARVNPPGEGRCSVQTKTSRTGKRTAFVGYVGEKDKEYADICARRVKAVGLQPFIAEYKVKPAELKEKLKGGLNEADLFVAIHSEVSLKRPWLHQEMGYFLGKNKGRLKDIYILSKRLDHVKDPDRMGFLSGFDCIVLGGRKRRSKGCLSKKEMSEAAKKTLETALDRLCLSLINEGFIKPSSDRRSDDVLQLTFEFPCCGKSEERRIAYKTGHDGHSIALLSTAECPKCHMSYQIDPLTWEPQQPEEASISRKDSMADSHAVEREYLEYLNQTRLSDYNLRSPLRRFKGGTGDREVRDRFCRRGGKGR